jgi:hypothetical protein
MRRQLAGGLCSFLVRVVAALVVIAGLMRAVAAGTGCTGNVLALSAQDYGGWRIGGLAPQVGVRGRAPECAPGRWTALTGRLVGCDRDRRRGSPGARVRSA